ncbi:hypothetical protein [Kytococcus sp. Marseille-QA3725]
MTGTVPRGLLAWSATLLTVPVVLAGCSGDESSGPEAEPVPITTPAAPGASGDEAESPSPRPDPSRSRSLTKLERYQRIAFIMPSDNVACLIEEQGVSCDIRNTSYQHTVVNAANCVEPTVELYREEKKPVWTCSRSSRFVDAQTQNDGRWVRGVPKGQSTKINMIEHTELPYGQEIKAFDFRCESQETGVRCERLSDGRGFRMASRDYDLF